MEATKKCPVCAEDIQAAALKCRFCGNIPVTPEWEQIVRSWRALPEGDRQQYWQSLTPEQREMFNWVNSALPSSAGAFSSARTSATVGDSIICPNPSCGYQGPPNRVARGSALVGCVLCFFLLVPGILYFMLLSGYRYICPRCGLQIRADN
jgi:predicted RNA-binding Zn-ribbon protein involved in translation (DUF1610 family)